MQLPPKSSLGSPIVAPSAGTEKKSPVAEAKAASAQLILESQGQSEGSRLPLEKIPASTLSANFLPINPPPTSNIKPKPVIFPLPILTEIPPRPISFGRPALGFGVIDSETGQSFNVYVEVDRESSINLEPSM